MRGADNEGKAVHMCVRKVIFKNAEMERSMISNSRQTFVPICRTLLSDTFAARITTSSQCKTMGWKLSQSSATYV